VAAKATILKDAAIDNIAVVLDVVKDLGDVLEKVPFIGPVAAGLSAFVKVYKVCLDRHYEFIYWSTDLRQEFKQTEDKRDDLLVRITDISKDLCGTVLRLNITNHVALLTRLKPDLENYARLSFSFIIVSKI
jgi:hypothetical protein